MKNIIIMALCTLSHSVLQASDISHLFPEENNSALKFCQQTDIPIIHSQEFITQTEPERCLRYLKTKISELQLLEKRLGKLPQSQETKTLDKIYSFIGKIIDATNTNNTELLQELPYEEFKEKFEANFFRWIKIYEITKNTGKAHQSPPFHHRIQHPWKKQFAYQDRDYR